MQVALNLQDGATHLGGTGCGGAWLRILTFNYQ